MDYAPLRSCAETVCVALATTMVVASPVRAQTTGPTREELELPQREANRPAGLVRVDRETSVRQNCPFDDSPLTASLQRVAFSAIGGGEVPPALARTLAGVTVPQGTQPLSVMCDVRDAANAARRQDGWIATVQVPQQNLTDTLKLEVVSARITELRITGNPGPYRDQIARQVGPLQNLLPPHCVPQGCACGGPCFPGRKSTGRVSRRNGC